LHGKKNIGNKKCFNKKKTLSSEDELKQRAKKAKAGAR
jgi:hypothetical protein